MMIRNLQPNVMIHDVTGADIEVRTVEDVYWFNIGTRLDVFSTSLEEIRNIGHELIRQANELDAKLQTPGYALPFTVSE